MKEPNWKQMYAILCGAASDALDVLPEKPEYAAYILRTALEEAEERYLQETEQQCS